MVRKRKASALEDFTELVALLPWWAGVAIAVICYLVLHQMAAPVRVAAVQPGQVGQLISQQLVVAFAMVGQYLLPIVSLMGAAVSYLRRRQRKALISDVAHSSAASALDGMAWHEFEALVGEAYAMAGYRVTETGGGGADGGVDLVLTKGGEKFLVQCKQWKAYKVGVDVVRQLYGVMAARGATGGFVVTSGSFTKDAKVFSEGRNMQLVDGTRLFAMIRQVRQSQTAKQAPSVKQAVAATSTSEQVCPKCGSSMVTRTTRNGVNAGGIFWGCSSYPKCQCVLQIEEIG